VSDILDTIDAALADMTLSPDAMRWSPDGPVAPDYYTRADLSDWAADHRFDVEAGRVKGLRA
jgi:hypothetical protein